MGKVKDFAEELDKLAGKPCSIIYIGIAVLLIVSEWKSPSQSISELGMKILLLGLSFVILTIFNTQYFKQYNRF